MKPEGAQSKSQIVRARSNDGTELVADVWNARAAPTLLLLPAGAEIRTVWHPVVSHLSSESKQRWRIVVADHRGHGDSGRSELYRFDQFIADLQCWINYWRGSPFVLAGGSIGGATGMVAAGEGAAIDGLVLLDIPTVPAIDKVLVERARIKNARDKAHPAMNTVDPRFIASGFIEDIFRDIDRWRRAACRLKIPTLQIAARDGTMGPQQRDQYREHVPHGEFATLATGHLVAQGDPSGVAALLNDFLTRHFGG